MVRRLDGVFEVPSAVHACGIREFLRVGYPKMMDVIFLDFDGVLNTDSTTEKYEGYTGIDPELVENLNAIISATGAKVVLSTSWRIAYGEKICTEVLVAAGFQGEIVGQTPRAFRRDKDILTALWENEGLIGKYVILDDDNDVARDPTLKKYWVATNLHDGLTPERAQKAISILKGVQK